MLREQLKTKGRESWLEDGDWLIGYRPILTMPGIKVRNAKPAALRRMTHLAAWREREAQTRDLPRNRILRDETILTCVAPTLQQGRIRQDQEFSGGANGKLVSPVLKILRDSGCHAGQHLPEAKSEDRAKTSCRGNGAFRVLLKHITDEEGIAPRLVASADELEAIAIDDNAPIRAQKGA